MTSAEAQRRWSRAYTAFWSLAGAELIGLIGFVAWASYEARQRHSLDDAYGVLAVPVGLAVGVIVARATRGARRLHGVLAIGGALLAIGGAVTAVVFLQLAQTAQGSCVAGLGEALLGLLGACVAVFGLLALGAGFCGGRALRAAA